MKKFFIKYSLIFVTVLFLLGMVFFECHSLYGIFDYFRIDIGLLDSIYGNYEGIAFQYLTAIAINFIAFLLLSVLCLFSKEKTSSKTVVMLALGFAVPLLSAIAAIAGVSVLKVRSLPYMIFMTIEFLISATVTVFGLRLLIKDIKNLN